jgi:hypothetical protein
MRLEDDPQIGRTIFGIHLDTTMLDRLNVLLTNGTRLIFALDEART